MRLHRRLAAAVAVLALGATLVGAAAKKKQKNAEIGTMPSDKRALHALNRLTFGPRPGDVERVQKMGVERWIELQLNPEKIDDSALEARLAPFRTLQMSTREIVENFPPPAVIKAIAEGKQSLPSDPAKRAVYQSAVARYDEKKERKAEAGDAAASGNANSNNPGDAMPPQASDAQREARMYAELQAGEVLDLPPDQRYAAIMRMPPDERDALARSMKGEDREQMLSDLTPQQRETLMALNNPQQVVANEVAQGKLVRAIYSERQLQEVMSDFWFNHFNVFINKGPDRYLITSYERDVIRPRALGKFKDLLLATAQSPAMLFYLDNWQSVGPDSAVAMGMPEHGNGRSGLNNNRPPRIYTDRYGNVYMRGGNGPAHPQAGPNGSPQKQKKQERRGLNENYAREIMELHTLGVDGGYTQKDVTELAKILTGWTIQEPRRGGNFEFNERMHEPGKKFFLGHVIKENGEKEGQQVIAMLASHPSTARFISRKLAMRFVSDNPPQPLVDRMAQTFLQSDGDIRDVLRTLFSSPEFWAAEDYRAKVKTPLEFVASAARATQADVTNPMPLVQTLNKLGMPLYGMQPPTGYSMKAETWVNSAALLNRMNFALTLGNGKMRGATADTQALLGANPPADAGAALTTLENTLLHGDVSPQTHQAISRQLDDPQVTGRRLDDPAREPNYGVITGLILGSPEFQRR